MILKLLAFLLLLIPSAFAGTTTSNGYFYLPGYGASGQAEYSSLLSKLQYTDGVIQILVNNSGGGIVTYDHGGTGINSAPNNNILVGTNTGWVPTIVPDCQDSGGQHLNYNNITRAFSCGTSSIGGGGGGGTPGGSSPQLQFNSSGAFGGVSGSGVDLNGNVGIGSATPGQKLDVQGNVRVSGTISGSSIAVATYTGTWNGNAITSAFGGTGQTTAPDDNILLGNGTAFQLKTIPNCPDTGGNHINYDSSTNTPSCGTSSSGGGGGGGSGNVGIGTINYFPQYIGISTLGPSNMVGVLGNVGIGSTAPGTKLDVGGTARATEVDVNGSGQLNIIASNGIGLGTSSVNFYLNTNGNIGINTAVAPSKLYVAGTGEFQGFKMTGNGVGSGYVLTSNSTGIGTWMPSTGGGGGSGTPGGSNPQLQYNNASSFGGVTASSVDSNGNIGIGTTLTPSALVVQGGAQVDSKFPYHALFNLQAGNLGIGTSNPVAKLAVLGNVGIGTVAGDKYINTTPPVGGMLIYGNVGIGTWIPANKLQVGGTVQTTGFKLTTGASNGYVLTSDANGVGTWQTGASGNIPSGGIIMWSGTVASIPAGFFLCDGTNGTPDLRDKFIVGAKQDSSGVAKTNITGSLTQTGGSTTITQANLPAVSLNVVLPSYAGGLNAGGSWNITGNTANGSTGNQTFNSATSNLGSGTTYTQPYYALAFIMKS